MGLKGLMDVMRMGARWDAVLWGRVITQRFGIGNQSMIDYLKKIQFLRG